MRWLCASSKVESWRPCTSNAARGNSSGGSTADRRRSARTISAGDHASSSPGAKARAAAVRCSMHRAAS
ncbi:hypothetical protein IWW47_002330 [Coemansia sp. RSA 2052]|nr:hypothetical protein IWW47_002330 [Coemansia sp. RSA 2052]